MSFIRSYYLFFTRASLCIMFRMLFSSLVWVDQSAFDVTLNTVQHINLSTIVSFWKKWELYKSFLDNIMFLMTSNKDLTRCLWVQWKLRWAKWSARTILLKLNSDKFCKIPKVPSFLNCFSSLPSLIGYLWDGLRCVQWSKHCCK